MNSGRLHICFSRKNAPADGTPFILAGDGYIRDSSFLTKEETDAFNSAFAGQEFAAAGEFVDFFKSYIRNLCTISENGITFPEPFSFRNGSCYDRFYDVLYFPYRETIFRNYLLRKLLAFILKGKYAFAKIIISAPAHYGYFHPSFYSPDQDTEVMFSEPDMDEHPDHRNTLIRNLYYRIHRLLKSPGVEKKKKKYRVLLLSHSRRYHDRFAGSLYEELSNSQEFELIVLCAETFFGVHTDERRLFSEKGIGFYELSDFKTPVAGTFRILSEALSRLDKRFHLLKSEKWLYNAEINLEWIRYAFRKLKPDLALTYSSGEHGRYLANAAASMNIPSLAFDYCLYTDDPYWMEQNVRYNLRACIGPATAELWKKRMDPTPGHVHTGYLRFDRAKKRKTDRNDFLDQADLDAGKKTLLFASTWSGTNEGFQAGKVLIVKELLGWCASAGWNLLIKKHPSESDTLLDQLIQPEHRKIARIFTDEPDPDILFDLISASDVVCCQNSGIGLEALYYEKPFCYIGAGEENLSSYSLLEQHGYSLKCNNVTEFIGAIPFLLSETRAAEIRSLKDKIIYLPQSSSAHSLIEQMRKLLAEK